MSNLYLKSYKSIITQGNTTWYLCLWLYIHPKNDGYFRTTTWLSLFLLSQIWKALIRKPRLTFDKKPFLSRNQSIFGHRSHWEKIWLKQSFYWEMFLKILWHHYPNGKMPKLFKMRRKSNICGSYLIILAYIIYIQNYIYPLLKKFGIVNDITFTRNCRALWHPCFLACILPTLALLDSWLKV